MTLFERDLMYVDHMLECIERIERFVERDRYNDLPDLKTALNTIRAGR